MTVSMDKLHRFIEAHFPEVEFALGQSYDMNAVDVHFRVKARVGKVEISWFDIFVGGEQFFPDLYSTLSKEIDRLSLQNEIDSIISGEEV